VSGGAPASYPVSLVHGAVIGFDPGMRLRLRSDQTAVVAFKGGGGPSWALFEIALESGAAKYVADVDGGLGDFVVDPSYVYWTEPYTGRVLRAAL
jgi:hypothetical protein